MNIENSIYDFIKNLKNKSTENELNEQIWAIKIFEDYLIHFSNLKSDNNITKLSENELNQFLHLFVIKRVASSKEELKTFLKILKKFITWIFEKKLINHTQKEAFIKILKEAKHLPNTAVVSDLLFELSQKTGINEFETLSKGYFIVDKIVNTDIFVKAIDKNEVLGPIKITEKLKKFLIKNMILNLEIGKIDENWYIIESGNVYLKLIDD